MAADTWREVAVLFPGMDEELIRECVAQCEGNTDMAIDLLLNMQGGGGGENVGWESSDDDDDEDARMAAALMAAEEQADDESYRLALRLQEEQRNEGGGWMGEEYGQISGGFGGGYGASPSFGGGAPLLDMSILQDIAPNLSANGGDLQGLADSLTEPLVKSFLPMLQEQFLQIKFPPMADVADLGADVVEYSTGEVRFKQLIVPEDKIKIKVDSHTLECTLSFLDISAKIQPIAWKYSKKNKFPRVSDSGVLKGKVANVDVTITFNPATLASGAKPRCHVSIGTLKLRVAKNMKSFIYNAILRQLEKTMKDALEQAITSMIEGKGF